MLKSSLFNKLISTYIILIIISLGLLALVSIEIFKSSYRDDAKQHLENTAYTLRFFIKDYSRINELGKSIKARVTIIGKAGNVLADSERDYTSMENHNNRPEIINARLKGIGENIRFSRTLSMDMLYVAIPLDEQKPDDIIIRVALPMKQIGSVTGQVYRTVGITFLLSLVIGIAMGFWLVRRIIKPVREIVSAAESISKGDFSKEIKVASKDEISALAESINLMNRELQKRFSAAMQYEQLRKDFVANVSHELRTPLTFIKGYVETLKEGGMEDKQNAAEFLNIIDRNVKQLTNLVEDLLELSRMESKANIARISPANINKLIEKVIENYQPAIISKQHTVIKNINDSIPEIKIDPDLIGKAIGNLLDNAIKYTSNGGKIELKAEIEADRLKIECIDNGIGIPQEDLIRIFERFYRVDKSRSREMGGTGLGLSIVKHIVQLHKGDVSVQSKPDKGSIFTIKLPLN
jgi:two-component system phosphate regulon sensor histidine kinase PhoR